MSTGNKNFFGKLQKNIRVGTGPRYFWIVANIYIICSGKATFALTQTYKSQKGTEIM